MAEEATLEQQKCRHHGDCTIPMDGVVYQRCRLCKETVAVEAHGAGMLGLPTCDNS